jgi:paraquat-inducible protein A
MREASGLVVCEGCDAVYRRTPLAPREAAHCERCGTELERHPGEHLHRLLPLTLASLVLYAIANLNPIVEIELRGLRSRTTLAGAVVTLAGEGLSPVALLVLATTLVFPLMQLLILGWLLAPRAQQSRPLGFALLVRAMQALRPWGMIEVFLLGVLVAIIKLSSMATVLPGAALWAFMALTVLLTVLLSFDPRGFWEMASYTPGTAPEQEQPA